MMTAISHSPFSALRLLACAALLLAGAMAVDAQDLVVKIGHAAQASGWMARQGIESELGARMAVEDLNARGVTIGGRRARFELVAVDDAALPAKARQVAHALVAAKVNGVVGHFTSGATIAAAPLYAEAGIAQISPSATSPDYTRLGLGTAFRVIADDTQIGRALGRYAIDEMKLNRLAVIDDGSTYGRGLAAEFSQAVAAAGGRIVDTQRVSPAAIDFNASLLQLMSKQAEAIFFGGFDRQAGRLLQQMHKLGIGVPLLGGDAICTPDLVSYYAVGAALDDQVVCILPGGLPETENPATARFAADFARRFRTHPYFYAPYAYDAVMTLADAMVRAGSSEPARYLPRLAETRALRGVTGTIAFDAQGDLLDPALGVFTYKDEERRRIRGLP